MHLILFLIAIILAFAGLVMISFAIPVIDVAAAALFTSGIIALVGGFTLAGLALAVRSLARIAERLEMQPLPLPPVASVGREDPAPRATRGAKPDVPPGPKRPSLLSWFGRASNAVTAPPPLEATAPPVMAEPAAPAMPDVVPPAAAETPPPAAQETPPASPPTDLAPLTNPPEEPRAAPTPPPPPPPRPPLLPPLRAPIRPVPPSSAAPPATAAGDTPANTVYKSGVIDGMAYTLFMDGAIEAELPQGKVRFGTIDELQKYLMSRPQ